MRPRAAISAVLAGGLLAGLIDIGAACLIYSASPLIVLQSVASGILGRAAFAGGWEAAAIGAACHFFIALCAAAVYVTISSYVLILRQQAVLGGLVFGALIFAFMHYIVVPLSNAAQAPMSPLLYAINLADHMALFGVPIALCAKYFAGRKRVFGQY
jgi:uncharacterized membrane protein YagU involved in acid resistance